MPEMTATIPHQLSRADAKRRIQEQVDLLRKQTAGVLTSFQETWTGDVMAFSGAAMGQTISGRLTVDEQAVHVSVALPWLLGAFANTIKSRIEQQGGLLLGHSQ
jgi:hypothetical protein